MSNYKKMYFALFNEITEIIERLKLIQQKAEQEYLNDEDIKLIEIKPITPKK